MRIEGIIEELKKNLSPERYIHSINVMETAEKLARYHRADVNKAKLAGILHDCAKEFDESQIRAYINKIGYKADKIELQQTILLHGVIGEYLARNKYGVTDQDVLNAIRWHTTGKAGMSTLEKIIYIADFIEPSRDYNGIEKIREAAFDNLDRCVLLCADSTICYVLQKGDLLFEKTVETRNYSLMRLKEIQNK